MIVTQLPFPHLRLLGGVPTAWLRTRGRERRRRVGGYEQDFSTVSGECRVSVSQSRKVIWALELRKGRRGGGSCDRREGETKGGGLHQDSTEFSHSPLFFPPGTNNVQLWSIVRCSYRVSPAVGLCVHATLCRKSLWRARRAMGKRGICNVVDSLFHAEAAGSAPTDKPALARFQILLRPHIRQSKSRHTTTSWEPGSWVDKIMSAIGAGNREGRKKNGMKQPHSSAC